MMGMIFYYVIFQQSKEEKKVQIEKITSYLINFVLFIWAGKVILHYKVFFTDPISVLARPSDTATFYIAIVLITGNIIYDVIRRRLQLDVFLAAFIPIFISASFVYEFIKISVMNNTSTWGYLTLLFVLLILIVSLHGKMEGNLLGFLMLALWTLGQFVLSFIFPYIVVYTYLISRLFLGVVFICLLIGFGYYVRRYHWRQKEI